MSVGEQRNSRSVGGALEIAGGDRACEDVDDDGHVKRTGTVMTASAHIITAVIGSGVLSLAWAVAQLGWVIGPVVIFLFSLVTWFCASLLADCYRYPDPIHGKRSRSYRDAVRAHLGNKKFRLCALAQNINLVGATIGYTITSAISMGAVQKSNCFHKNSHDAECHASSTFYIIIFTAMQLILSQLPNFHDIWWLSYIAAIMSFAYSLIGLGLSAAKMAEGVKVRTSLTGLVIGVDVSTSEKVWKAFQAIGNIAFAYTYANVLIEIQDTLKSGKPENEVMKKASLIGVSITATFYMLCGLLGYAAFGNDAPGNFLTGFGFYEPFWLVDIGNICVVVHLVGAYQVFCQPFFEFVEEWCQKRWPKSSFMTRVHAVELPFLGVYSFTFFRVLWRTAYVILTGVISIIFPFFNHVIGLIGAVSWWPLTLYFPINMHIRQANVQKFSAKWTLLMIMLISCLIISIAAVSGAVQGIIQDLKTSNPFKMS